MYIPRMVVEISNVERGCKACQDLQIMIYFWIPPSIIDCYLSSALKYTI